MASQIHLSYLGEVISIDRDMEGLNYTGDPTTIKLLKMKLEEEGNPHSLPFDAKLSSLGEVLNSLDYLGKAYTTTGDPINKKYKADVPPPNLF